eukprot:8929641-Alexandrium_andersonii.AAC.1
MDGVRRVPTGHSPPPQQTPQIEALHYLPSRAGQVAGSRAALQGQQIVVFCPGAGAASSAPATPLPISARGP